MIDLNSKVSFGGTVSDRGSDAVKILIELNEREGTFKHNEVDIIIYRDSTPREIEWQYRYKALAKLCDVRGNIT